MYTVQYYIEVCVCHMFRPAVNACAGVLSSPSASRSSPSPAVSGQSAAPLPRPPSPDERDRLVALGCSLLGVLAHKDPQSMAGAAATSEWFQFQQAGLRPLVERDSVLQSLMQSVTARNPKKSTAVAKVRSAHGHWHWHGYWHGVRAVQVRYDRNRNTRLHVRIANESPLHTTIARLYSYSICNKMKRIRMHCKYLITLLFLLLRPKNAALYMCQY